MWNNPGMYVMSQNNASAANYIGLQYYLFMFTVRCSLRTEFDLEVKHSLFPSS